MTYQHLWNTAKEVGLWETFIALNIYVQKESFQISSLNFILRKKSKRKKGSNISMFAESKEVEKRKTENYWSQKLVLWKDTQNWQIFSFTDFKKEKKRGGGERGKLPRLGTKEERTPLLIP